MNKVPFEPRLSKSGLCSDCGVVAILADNGNMKICPRCYGVLWSRDSEDHLRKKQAEATAAAARMAERRAFKTKLKAREEALKNKDVP